MPLVAPFVLFFFLRFQTPTPTPTTHSLNNIWYWSILAHQIREASNATLWLSASGSVTCSSLQTNFSKGSNGHGRLQVDESNTSHSSTSPNQQRQAANNFIK